MVDVFISYPQRERALMLPIQQRLEALGLILFVDVDGRLDGEATFPEALDKGVRAAKVVLGCWSPWALTRPWVQTECAIGKDENKLVAVERTKLTSLEVPALFYLNTQKWADGANFRIKVDAEVTHGATDGLLTPGAGKHEWFKDLDIGPEMVLVPGSPAFAIGRFTLTFAEWDAAQAHPEWRKQAKIDRRMPEDHHWGRGNQPIIDVAWSDAKWPASLNRYQAD